MISVIVVPETKKFSLDVSHGDCIYINKNLGIPKLKDHNALYVAPFWLEEKQQGVERIYHITDHYMHHSGEYYEIIMGNSFRLNSDKPWSGMGNHRKFEYHSLKDFGMMELMPGYLIPLDPKKRWPHAVR